MFRFSSALFLLLLALVPAAIAYRRRRRPHPPLRMPSLTAAREISPSPVLRGRWVVPFLKYGAMVLLILAMARPQWGTREEMVLTEGINIVLAVDLSESMAALDFRREGKIVNRLEAVKGVVGEFVRQRTGDRIGMVVFGTEAYTQLPLTRDYNAIVSILDRLKIGAAGKNTAIGDAIGISLKRLSDIESESNIIILLTDGQSNAGQLSPRAASEIAMETGVKIYTIGVGTRGRAPFLVRDPVFGERYVYQQVTIDEKTLKAIAEKTDGLYFRAENTEGLATIYDRIDALEKTEVEVKTFSEFNDLYPFFLLPAFTLLALWAVLANTRFLRLP
jgi:Ca-activated chloride channel family protein